MGLLQAQPDTVYLSFVTLSLSKRCESYIDFIVELNEFTL